MSNFTGKIIPTLVGIAFWLYQVIASFILSLVFSSTPNTVSTCTSSILMESATSIAHRIRNKKVTSYEVVKVFIHRIKEINPVLNCVIDNRFEEAIEDAKKVDELIASGTKTVEELEAETPFLGVPFTVKDSLAIKGLLQTTGLIARKGYRPDEDSEVVALMRQAGAIPLAITNVPELCFWWESNNPLYGRTNNPYNTNRTPAGSSGGEAAVLSATGSPLGLGSDLGGSIRVPANFCGIFGHKPSGEITPLKGMHPDLGPDLSRYFTIGPMSRYSIDLLPTLKVLTKNAKVDLKLNEPVDITKLKYYYMDGIDGTPFVSSVDPEIKKAIEKIVNHFKKSHGITVQRVNINKLRESLPIWFAKLASKEGSQLPKALTNNQGEINIYKELVKAPLRLSNHSITTILMGILTEFAPPYGSPKHKYYSEKAEELIKEFEDLLGTNGVFIYPVQPTAALYHYETLVKPLNFTYTGIFNILGLPSTQCPMGLNKDGLPLGIQVIAGRNQDRLTIAVAGELEKAFGGWVPPPTHGTKVCKKLTLVDG